MDWPIQEIARLTGTTSRTLRHYDAIGLLPPTSIAPNGFRCYDETALLRLQRILLLKELGLPLASIAEMLDRRDDPVEALTQHLVALGRERDRIDRQLAAVTATTSGSRSPIFRMTVEKISVYVGLLREIGSPVSISKGPAP